MNTSAVVMMVVAMLLVWGGLVLALVNIKRSPEQVDELDTPAEGEQADGRTAQDDAARVPAHGDVTHRAGDGDVARTGQRTAADAAGAPGTEQAPGHRG
nr:methionine/alanine import family NSS transporter small subunit [Kocuria rhizophila]